MSIGSAGVWNQRLEIEICYLAVQRSVQKDADRIRVSYGRNYEIQQPAKGVIKDVITDFLNWPTMAEDILRFTTQYGAIGPNETNESLNRRFRSDGQAWQESGSEWEFLFTTWRQHQLMERANWELLAQRKTSTTALKLPIGEMVFDRLNDRVHLAISDLLLFIRFRMNALPPERMKKCKRPVEEGCDTPYFIATHLGQEYCTAVCAGWAQKAVKREWWRRRQKQLKGGKR